ncbi:DUF4279 domain-containing protein [Yersinia enterocolitica]|uniref:DUF4279 domain-containing protein n=1 Tax=Yersinia enterocolitica TaxID=630 RepID=UPI0028B92BCF|nr:DUF4279 domain-containing protein [Yersinia enterocolitica]
MDKTTVMAYFSIYGDSFDIEGISQRLCLKPDDVRVKGLVPLGRKRPSIETSWKISTEDEESYDINVQLDKLIALLKDKKSELQNIKNTYGVNFIFVFVVKIENGEKPGMRFDVEKIKFISDINAEIDIDLYIYS